MILYLDTTKSDLVKIAIKDKNGLVAKKSFNSHRAQAEKLLPAMEKFLKANKIKLSDIKGIEAANRGGSFTSLRIGVITANALAYALDIPLNGSKKFKAIEPIYDREPEITIKKAAGQGGKSG